MSNSNLGTRIRRLRLKHPYTQGEVESKIGISSGMVSHWERGTRKPSPENLKKLEHLLGPLDTAIDFDGEFGRWLDKEIKTRSINRNELARLSGIHWGTIDNILAGKVTSPRGETMRKLAGALGRSEKESVGSEVIEETERSNEIPGLGSFEEFSPYEEGEIPDCAGVYVLYDAAERPIYVGKSKKISRRLKDHQDKFWFKEPIVKQAAYIEVPEADLRGRLEQILIKFLKKNVVVNIHHVDR